VARLLVVGGATPRALELTRELVAEGHAVRSVATDHEEAAAIRLAGGEAWTGDPDVIGTLRYALENVTLLLWLLGDDERPEIHGSRLAMMLEKTIDTTVRGVVYEAGPDEGAKTVEDVAGYNEIPFRIVPLGGDLRGAIDALMAR
jgi:hypothetical protein